MMLSIFHNHKETREHSSSRRRTPAILQSPGILTPCVPFYIVKCISASTVPNRTRSARKGMQDPCQARTCRLAQRMGNIRTGLFDSLGGMPAKGAGPGKFLICQSPPAPAKIAKSSTVTKVPVVLFTILYFFCYGSKFSRHKNDQAVLLGADLLPGLQLSQHQRVGRLGHLFGGIREHPARFLFR